MAFGKKKKEFQSDRPYLEPYEKATREMGAGFESQLWMSKDAQPDALRGLGAGCKIQRSSGR